MLRPPRIQCPGGRTLRVLACLLPLAAPLRAGADVAVFEAVVPLAGPTEADRSAALVEALRTAVVRASGQSDAASNPAIARADPARYLQRYSTTADHMLKVGFDARAMDGLLQEAGLPFWPLERPVVLVLLVVPSVGGGQRAVLATDPVPERLEVERAALARGLPISWPEQAVSAGQVRTVFDGGMSSPLAESGSGNVRLVGVGSGGPIAWRFFDGSQTATSEGSLQDGANLAADRLAARYAPASSRGTSTTAIRVGGIEDVRSYAGVVEYLRSLSLVRGVGVEGLAGHVVSLDVTLRGDLEQLRRIAALGTHLKPDGGPGPEGQPAPNFTYQP